MSWPPSKRIRMANGPQGSTERMPTPSLPVIGRPEPRTSAPAVGSGALDANQGAGRRPRGLETDVVLELVDDELVSGDDGLDEVSDGYDAEHLTVIADHR